MKRYSITLVLVAGLPLLAACGGGSDSAASPATVTVTRQAAAPAPSSTVPAPTSAIAPTPIVTTAAVDFPMPDVTGQVLQDAQDAMQSVGVMYSISHDARGVRHQVLDRDWKVCNQNVPAGQHVGGNVEGKIDFGVVKLSETCP